MTGSERPAAACSLSARVRIDGPRPGPYTSTMVEYAILVAGTALRSLAYDITNFAADINWAYVGYAALLLVVLRIAFWAFRPGR